MSDSPGTWHRLAPAADIPVGEGREFVAAGRMVAVFHVGDTFHAMDGLCPHAGGPIGEGKLQGHVVTCPWHGWQFDVTSGQHCLNRNLKHETFPLEVREGNLYVLLPVSV